MPSISPTFKNPCDLANQLPDLVADFLDLETQLKRRFREDSITDIFIVSILSLPGNHVVVLTPPEPISGGDFDIIAVAPSSSTAIQFRIQAKRLTPHPKDWNMGSYTELAHRKNSGSQSKLLISSARREEITTIPLYAFYNPAHVCAASGHQVAGIELASAAEIYSLVQRIVKARPRRLPFKRISVVRNFFFPLRTLLCPSRREGSRALIPLPNDMLRSVEAATTDRRKEFETLDHAHVYRAMPAPNPPDLRSSEQITSSEEGIDRASELPPEVRSAIEKRERRIIKSKIKRPKIIMISEER